MRTGLLPGRTLSLACAVWLLCGVPGGRDMAFSQQDGDSRDRGTGQAERVARTDFASLRDQAVKAIHAGRYEAADEVIRRGRRIADRFELDAWCLVEAELECTRGRYARGGLAAMRVVILRSTSVQVGRAYYWAGRAYEGLGRIAKAISLYEACIAHKTSSETTREMAASRLAALKGGDHADPPGTTHSTEKPQQKEAVPDA